MKCTRCGYEMENNTVCPGCGLDHSAPVPAPAPYQMQGYPQMPTAPQIPAGYAPISAWGYVGWNLLFSIPCVGFIMLLIFALGGTSNINLRNYARSFFCITLLVIILTAIFVLLSLLGGFALTELASISAYTYMV